MLTFKNYNVNPKGKRVGDCTIRAIAYASSQSWEKVHEDLFKIAMKEKCVVNEKRCEEKYLDQLGFIKMKQPRKRDNTKYLVRELDKLIDTNRYDVIVSVANHLTCVDGNNIIDIWDCGYKSVGNYWFRKRDLNAVRPADNTKKKTRVIL